MYYRVYLVVEIVDLMKASDLFELRVVEGGNYTANSQRLGPPLEKRTGFDFSPKLPFCSWNKTRKGTGLHGSVGERYLALAHSKSRPPLVAGVDLSSDLVPLLSGEGWRGAVIDMPPTRALARGPRSQIGHLEGS